MNQRIDGDNNVQVGHVEGDFNLGPDDPLDPDNPNLIECPSCWKLASRYAAPCPKCGYNIAGHFAALDREERRKRLVGQAKVCGAIFVGAGVLTNMSWVSESLKWTLGIMAFLALLAVTALLSAADKLK